MANSGKQSPLGVNVLGALLNSTALTINPFIQAYIGTSKDNDTYTFGDLVNGTCLNLLTWAINDGWLRGPDNSNTTLTNTTYNNLISIGSTTIPALGNSKPSTYDQVDPAGIWSGLGYPATTGYAISGNTGQGQSASWFPYDTTNPNASVTQWGYIRLHALQGWNEFNWNGTTVTASSPEYKEFCSSFMTADSWLTSTNKAVMAAQNAKTFLDGTYSNMNDLTSADIAGVSLSTNKFGQDLINLGKAINLSRIDAFGLPSVLLGTLAANSAVIQDLTLALLATGLTTTEIAQITSGTIPFVTPDQEKKIYTAFLLIAGENLAQILAPLQCVTQGFETLADLLDVKKLFPTSYSTLTVPMYNDQLGLPTNSKTYYLIYDNGGVNSALTTPAMNEYVGLQIPAGAPPVYDNSLSPENYTDLSPGFGSYLTGILPQELAVPAGAFSFTMRQIRNIEQVDFLKFAKATQSMETMQGLNLVNGTSKPTDETLATDATDILALGCGPHGTYTYSDFFGCMSGLPYPWDLIKNKIGYLQTTKLLNIYQELFLATTWEQATVTVQYTVSAGPTYTVTGLTINNPGGGYGRGTAVDPVITISNGGSGVGIVGRDSTVAGSNGSGNFGRITSVSLTNAGTPGGVIPTATIQAPPIATLPVSASGAVSTSGVNVPAGTVGWQAPMNAVVQAYIDQANLEIAAIQTAQPKLTQLLQTYWNILGAQLTSEQRARAMAIAPVPIPKDDFQNPYPAMIQTFVDSIPTYAQDTLPNMSAQTLENISDLSIVGGQSIVAMMRQERNQVRLQDAGIELDNNISDQLSPTESRLLTTNGTSPTAVTGIASPCDPAVKYTFPAWPTNTLNGANLSPVPKGIYQTSPATLTGEFTSTGVVKPGDITPILECDPNPVAGPYVPVGPAQPPVDNAIVIIKPPAELDPTNVRSNLDTNYTSSTLLPASATIQEAIDQVITCNCDCWV